MRDGSGIVRFTEASGGTSAGAQVSPLNSSQLFYRGIIYVGVTFAVLDQNEKTVTGMTNGSSVGFQSTTTTTTDTTNAFFFGGDETTRTQQSTVHQVAAAESSATPTPAGTVSITDTSPILEFEADGVAFFFGDLDQTQQNEVVNIRKRCSDVND